MPSWNNAATAGKTGVQTMRWIFLLAALTCAALMFGIDSPGWLALDILGVLVFATLAVFGFAAARIDDRARTEGAMLTATELAEIRARAAKPGAGTPQVPASADAVAGSIAALRARAEARRNRSL